MLYQTDQYQHRRHNKNLPMAHLIFVTKYRKPLFTGTFHEDVKQSLYECCAQNHWYIKRMEADRDHIHILLQYNTTDSIASIVRTLNNRGNVKPPRKGALLPFIICEKSRKIFFGFFHTFPRKNKIYRISCILKVIETK